MCLSYAFHGIIFSIEDIALEADSMLKTQEAQVVLNDTDEHNMCADRYNLVRIKRNTSNQTGNTEECLKFKVWKRKKSLNHFFLYVLYTRSPICQKEKSEENILLLTSYPSHLADFEPIWLKHNGD